MVYLELRIALVILFSTIFSIPAAANPQQQQRHAQYNWDHNYSPYLYNNSPLISDDSQQLIQRTLVMQSLPPGPEEELLSITSRVNRAYAKRLGFDYLSYVGPDSDSFLLNDLFRLRKTDGDEFKEDCKDSNGDDCTTGTDSETSIGDEGDDSTASSPPAIPMHNYDTVMVLQSDAVIVQLDYNIRNLVQADKLVACGVDKNAMTREGVWNVYSDVVVWNLNHPLVHNVTQLWFASNEYDKRKVAKGPDGDSLAAILMNLTDQEGDVVQEIPKDMVNGLSGTIIKQDRKSTSTQSITEKDLPRMIPVMQGISDNVCYRYYPQCEIVY